MDKNEVISGIKSKIEQQFIHESSGHDWWHIYRVWKLAKKIAKSEAVDQYVVELAALLHDIADWKFNDGDDKAGGIAARALMEEYTIDEETIAKVVDIIDHVSYKGAGVHDEMKSLEGQIVQDADRLDAIGAIGIARTFAYGGFKGRPLYDPSIVPVMHHSFEAYKKNVAPTINHFYEKLLLLKDRMNTKTGKKIASQRHEFMLSYLKQFFDEWDSEPQKT
ncbi:MAG: HD domain-containing protein [Prolixibacteraceae bacterium]